MLCRFVALRFEKPNNHCSKGYCQEIDRLELCHQSKDFVRNLGPPLTMEIVWLLRGSLTVRPASRAIACSKTDAFAASCRRTPMAGSRPCYASGLVLEAACWAHARRKFYVLYMTRCTSRASTRIMMSARKVSLRAVKAATPMPAADRTALSRGSNLATNPRKA